MTYSTLAGGYDAFTGDVNYTAWADYFEKRLPAKADR